MSNSGSANLNVSERSPGETAGSVVFFPSLDAAHGHLKNAGDDRRLPEAIIVDMGEEGFALPASKLLRFSSLLPNVLPVHGICLLLSQEQALVFQNNEHNEQLAMETYIPADSVFVAYPLVIETVRNSIPAYSYLDAASLSNSFKQQLLKNSVLHYRNLRDSDSTLGLNQIEVRVLELVDSRNTVEQVREIAARHNVPSFQCDMILLSLERKRKIYPVFERVEFLSRCFRKRRSFRLGHYMVALRIVSKPQLIDLLEMQEQMEQKGKKPLLGQLLVRDGYLTEQALSLYLQDQAFTAGMQNPTGTALVEGQANPALGGAMIGHLQTIEPQDLLQSLSGARKTGRLFLESNLGVANLEFVDGNIVHSSVNKLSGAEAVTEFLVFWREGIFTFSTVPAGEFDHRTEKRPPLSRLLMDSAFLIDKVEGFLKSMPEGEETVLEKDSQFESKLNLLFADPTLKFPDESAVKDRDKEEILRFASRVDGINSLRDVATRCQSYPAYKAYLAMQILYEASVLVSADNVLTRALREYQGLIKAAAVKIGNEKALKILQATHRITFENKALANLFLFTPDLQLSLSTKDFSSENFAVSDLVHELKRWEETYKAYLARM